MSGGAGFLPSTVRFFEHLFETQASIQSITFQDDCELAKVCGWCAITQEITSA